MYDGELHVHVIRNQHGSEGQNSGERRRSGDPTRTFTHQLVCKKKYEKKMTACKRRKNTVIHLTFLHSSPQKKGGGGS